VLLLLAGCTQVQVQPPADNDNHNSLVGEGAASCSALLGTAPVVPARVIDADGFSVSVWNAQKGHDEAWRSDFDLLVDRHDLVLLQEFSRAPGWTHPGFWSFTPGFAKGATQTGVATLSRTMPLVRCELYAREPVLRTPKATTITEFSLGVRGTLVVVNLHAVNFSVGLVNFALQIDEAVRAVTHHDGPLIFAGDFNTWRGGRTRLVEKRLGELRLEAVEFSEDSRKRVLGRYLDHVYVRGLELIEATTRRVATSDHNPMILRFRL
jgi:endonuclease/exonuclease/phosphatase (EEP) superfamily protein YafD